MLVGELLVMEAVDLAAVAPASVVAVVVTPDYSLVQLALEMR